MEVRQLGKTDLQVSALGLGCARLGSVAQAGGDQSALRLLGTALDAGINFFDTADIYGQGSSEILLSKALKGHRDNVIVATKAGYCLSHRGQLAKWFKPVLRRIIQLKPGFAKTVKKARASQKEQNFSGPYLERRIEDSLRRLRTDRLDLFQLHSPPSNVLKSGEAFETLDRLKARGKIRHYGVACLTAGDALLCVKQQGVAAVQLELNLLSAPGISDVLAAAESAGVGIIARQIFAGGLLIRSSAEVQPEHCDGRPETFDTIKSRLREFETVAADLGCSLRQLALQFVVRRQGISTALLGTTNPAHLTENIALLDGLALDARAVEQIKSVYVH